MTAQYDCSDASTVFRCVAELAPDGGAGTPVASGDQLDTGEPGSYTLTVTAEDFPGNISSRSVRYTVTSPGDVTATVTGGETVTTGASATVEAPVQTSIVVPTGVSGTVSVDSQPSGAPPAGFTLFGQQLVIEGPAATAASPYQLSFRVDQSALAGLAPADVQVWRNGVTVGGCTDPDAAVPDPCIAFRGFTPEAGDGGDALVTVRTSRFSTWTLGAVDYNLVGPYAPVDALPVVNTTKAGSAVPVKFRLGGDRGLDIFSAGYPKVVATTSCTGGTDEVEQTVNVGTSALTYDAASGAYTTTGRAASRTAAARSWS